MPDTTYDPEADALYIQLGSTRPVDAEEVAPNVMLDYDAEGRLVGVEVLTASKLLALGDWNRARLPGPGNIFAAE